LWGRGRTKKPVSQCMTMMLSLSATMKKELTALLREGQTVQKDGIFVTKEISEKTVWDELAIENPTHAVISAADEADAAKKSAPQISDISEYVADGDVLLDCGTGYGRVAKYLLPERTLGGYIGVDSAFTMLSMFKERYQKEAAEQKTPLLLVNSDIHTLPLKDESVDTVIVCAVFLHNHKEVVGRAVKEIKRVMKPGGTILVYSSFPRAATLMGIQGLAYQAVLNLIGKPYKNGPVRYYTRREVLHLFDGFTSVDVKYVGYVLLPKSIIIFPQFLDDIWRQFVAKPVNYLAEKITPSFVKCYFAMDLDVVAKK
jgi:ubiquinone/menaquinone biosynthesis C-methylase UbiE